MTSDFTYPMSETIVSWLESFCLDISRDPSCYSQEATSTIIAKTEPEQASPDARDRVFPLDS